MSCTEKIWICRPGVERGVGGGRRVGDPLAAAAPPQLRAAPRRERGCPRRPPRRSPGTRRSRSAPRRGARARPSQAAFRALQRVREVVARHLLAVVDGPDARRRPPRPGGPRNAKDSARDRLLMRSCARPSRRSRRPPLTKRQGPGQGQRDRHVADDGRALVRRRREHERQAQEAHEPDGPAQEAEDLRGRVVAVARAPPPCPPACRGGGRARRGARRGRRPAPERAGSGRRPPTETGITTSTLATRPQPSTNVP